jgi:hypothetical protein
LAKSGNPAGRPRLEQHVRRHARRKARRITLAVMLAAVVAGAATVPLVVSSRLTERDVVVLLSDWAGAPVSWRGQPEIALFPTLQIAVADVAVRDGRGAGAAEVAFIPALRVSFKTLPLLWGRIEPDTVFLLEPRIAVSGQPADPAARSGGGRGLGALFGPHGSPRPDAIVIRDGVIRYPGPHSGDVDAISEADLRLGWDEDTGTLEGRFVAHGRAVEIEADLEEPWKLLAASGTRGRLMLSVAPARPGEAPEHRSFGPFRMEGTFRLAGSPERSGVEALQIGDASFRFEGSSARGSLAVSRVGDRPRLEGLLGFERVDLTPYLRAWLPDDLAELLAQPVSARWLKLADVDLALAASRVDLGAVRLDETAIRLAIQDGHMSVRVAEAGLAAGEVQGDLTVSASGSGVAARVAGRVHGVSLADAGEHLRRGRTSSLIGSEQPPQGSGTATFDLSARGDTIRAMIGSLAGRASAEVTNGSLDGADTVSTLERVVDDRAGIAEGEAPFIPIAGRTRFSRLTARLVAGEGVASLERLHLAGERFDITVSGELDLTGGELTAQGSARLFGDGPGDGADVLVELPFGVGGTLREPMGAPGIPRQHPDRRAVQHVAYPESAARRGHRARRGQGGLRGSGRRHVG